MLVSVFVLPELWRTRRWRELALVASVLTLGAQGAAVPAAQAVPVGTANVAAGPAQGVGRYALGQLKLAPAAPGSPTANTPAGSGTPAGVTVAVRDSKLGKILVDGKGRTLYLFEADKGTNSTCYGACAKAWPPLTTTGKPRAGSGVSPALLGTTARTDHTTEVTYKGHPLYYFVSDTKPGDITGQGLNSFGGKWYVLNPKGDKIDKG
jgi:predicted lipoprotein with Yx(FWY)xxD motif